MMRRNVWAVIRREYVQRVRSRWFILATVGGPLFMAALFVVPAYFAARSDSQSDDLAVVDGTGVLFERVAPRLEEAGFVVFEQRWHADVVTELRRSATDGVIGGFLMLDELTLESGEAMYFTTERPGTLRQFSMQSAVARSALEYQLEQNGVDVETLLQGGELEIALIGEGGVGADMDDPQFAVAYIGAFFLYMVILLYAVSVMRATLEEKTSRIVEVIISSMKPWHLMLGKIVGVGAVSMTQMGIWIGTGILLFAMGLPMLVSAQPELADLSSLREAMPGAGMLLLFVGFFVFGFFMFAGLYAAVGAMCSSDEEAQQAQIPVMMFLIVPIIMITGVIEDPNSAMAVGLSLFPLFTPILMWGRVAGGGVPAWEIALSFVLMFLAIFAIAWVAGRIYRVGILMSGKRPTVPELWRWIREA